MRTWFVTRHAGARIWAEQQGMTIDEVAHHLDVERVEVGDLVIGSLPVHLAAEVCEAGARYIHLTLELPPELRGIELTADDMSRLGARLEEYRVERVV